MTRRRRPGPQRRVPIRSPTRFASYDAAFRENAYLRYPAVEQSLSLVRAQANGHDYFVERGTHRFWIREGLSWNAKLYGPFAIVNQ